MGVCIDECIGMCIDVYIDVCIDMRASCVIYIDADVLVLRPLQLLWLEFAQFNSSQARGLMACIVVAYIVMPLWPI